MRKSHIIFGVLLVLSPLVMGCQTQQAADEQITVAKAQKEIKVGMTSAQVVEVLGSPNMVTTDEKRRETWVYDRVSQTVSTSGSGVWILIASAGKSTASSSSRTLTIIVKFDEQSRVRDFSYRTSSF